MYAGYLYGVFPPSRPGEAAAGAVPSAAHVYERVMGAKERALVPLSADGAPVICDACLRADTDAARAESLVRIDGLNVKNFLCEAATAMVNTPGGRAARRQAALRGLVPIAAFAMAMAANAKQLIEQLLEDELRRPVQAELPRERIAAFEAGELQYLTVETLVDVPLHLSIPYAHPRTVRAAEYDAIAGRGTLKMVADCLHAGVPMHTYKERLAAAAAAAAGPA
jgi:hypothetical protein